MSEKEMELSKYLGTISDQLVNELKPILEIKSVTTNTDLLGKYTEAAIRNLVFRIVCPMRVCTGAVIDFPMPEKLRQIDLIIWAPFPAPAIFEVADFGLVPRSSAFGVIEIKRSNYKGVDDRLEEFFADVDAKKIVSDLGGPIADYSRRPGLGIICVLDSAPSLKISSLMNDGKVLAIFERESEKTIVRHDDVLRLVNFLQYVTWRYRVQASQPSFPEIILGASLDNIV